MLEPQTGLGCSTGLHQVLAVDVLTGKAKEMKGDKTMRMPPLLEDASIGKYVNWHVPHSSIQCANMVPCVYITCQAHCRQCTSIAISAVVFVLAPE